MAIAYPQAAPAKKVDSGLMTVLTEAAEHFQGENIRILGEEFADILHNDDLFGDYVEKLCEGADSEESEDLAQLITNSRLAILSESFNGIQPVNSLTPIVIRTLWPRLGLRNGVPTTAVKAPHFQVTWHKPYVKDENGNKHYLPQSIVDGSVGSTRTIGATDTAANLAAGVNLFALASGTASKAAGDSVDRNFKITKATVTALDAGDANGEAKVVTLNAICALNGSIMINGTAVHTDGTENDFSVYGQVDFEEGTLSLLTKGATVVDITFAGKLCSEMNTRAMTIMQETVNEQVSIDSGEHINAPLPHQTLTDMMAMWKIDAAASAVDIMTKTFGRLLDVEVKDVLTADWDGTQVYENTFDCTPIARFSGSQTDWFELLKRMLDHMATSIRQANNFEQGQFVIVGNELDIDLIPNVSWTFQGSSDARSGVNVNYSLGAVAGANRYKIIGSSLIPQGALYMFYASDADDETTYRYYPYTFSVEQGYSDPKASYVPNLMMAKRHEIRVFRSAIGKINISNNDGVIR